MKVQEGHIVKGPFCDVTGGVTDGFINPKNPCVPLLRFPDFFWSLQDPATPSTTVTAFAQAVQNDSLIRAVLIPRG